MINRVNSLIKSKKNFNDTDNDQLLVITFFDCDQNPSSDHGTKDLTFSRNLSSSAVTLSSSNEYHTIPVYSRPEKTEMKYSVSITILCVVIFLLSMVLFVVWFYKLMDVKYLRLWKRKVCPCAYIREQEMEASDRRSLVLEETSENSLAYILEVWHVGWGRQSINQSIKQTSIAPISPAKPDSVARQPKQCSTAKSNKQFKLVTDASFLIPITRCMSGTE